MPQEVIYENGQIVSTINHPDAPTQPIRMDKAGFNELCYAVLGGIASPSGTVEEKYAAGMGIFQAALEDSAVHASPTVRGAARHFNDVDWFVKDKVALFLGILEGASIINQTQMLGVLAAWPEA